MASITNLPIRESEMRAASSELPIIAGSFPSLWQWIKAGAALTFGAWIAAVLLFLPSLFLYLKFLVVFLGALARAMR